MYTMHKAKSMLSKLVKEAASGKEVIIARGDVPVARLVPIKVPKQRKPGTLKGRLKAKPGAFDPLNTQELRLFGIE
ncbi:MAG TPA: type II toxin-antitoxin system prevent-host-death family antitoxin [Candidatus Angelobacter sp.]